MPVPFLQSSIRADITVLRLSSSNFGENSLTKLVYAAITYFLSLYGEAQSFILSPSDFKTMKRIPGWTLSHALISASDPKLIMKVAKKMWMALVIEVGITFILVEFL